MSQKEKTDIAIGITVVLIALAFILYYSFSDQGFLRAEKPSTNDVNVLVIGGKNYNQLKDSSVIAVYEKELDSTSNLDTTTFVDTLMVSSVDSVIASTELLNVEVENEMQSVDTKIEEFEKNKPKYRTFDFSDEPNSSQSSNDLQDNFSTQIDTPVTAEIIEYESPAKECVILIGSFSKNTNSRKLKANLKKDGYAIFEVPYNNLMRIGIYTGCDTSNLNKQLRIIRKNYASDAIIFIEE